ncbi:aminoacyl-tRNA hydrolase [Candidatus Woesebacteria bacterium CG_4_10_14_0_2_um_filter_39_14]|uniref:Peptidyl-tRNA hydrolase n=3 Tax=Microgenomates group TaxID=1794810 RepID=A0A2M6YPU6_9BACT|nr:MAG: aminoacyl-tRNA hydrolase [Candidatus Shapirobacteria bacterium CG07_land_8_20_14_0_80_39_12]PIZ50080.1 MAG: aminoacyl-tRNA hydrolase [Candidatus Woesebacteria bacterium CG_4_10_14_0_2_um_filter_39_14]PJA49395.1 MAG: aminoacyl-tRNA hydrolase [Candidatus Shapirobacteria bacterium CG_4_9_14_3_um_filter_39_13]
MKLIIGLGNPGEKYQNSRHNLGFMVLDEFARKILPLTKTKWGTSQKANSQFIIFNSQFISSLRETNSFILVKPQTMMNASGFAVAKMSNFYKVKPEDIWVVHDDVDLPLGKIKIRLGGAAAGHHGVESIIQQLGTDKFVRFRLGIGHPGKGNDKLVERYVLQGFAFHEAGGARQAVKKVIQALKKALKDGLVKTMSEFN